MTDGENSGREITPEQTEAWRKVVRENNEANASSFITRVLSSATRSYYHFVSEMSTPKGRNRLKDNVLQAFATTQPHKVGQDHLYRSPDQMRELDIQAQINETEIPDDPGNLFN